jgi:quercetin 2,3-dioxygenase
MTSAPPSVHRPRALEHLIAGRPTRDGAGVQLTRLLTPALHQRLDPFLMLDHFGADNADGYIAGFPDHPHRGFETVTYMIEGRMRHRDSAGHQGLLDNGAVQWMTAGRGVIHSEMPEQEDGRMEGFQLWLNLPARQKMMPAWYRDFPAASLPRWHDEAGVTVTVIAGATHGVPGAVQRTHTEPLYLVVHMAPGTVFEQPLPANHNAFLCVYRGAIHVEAATGADEVPAGPLALLANTPDSDGVRLRNAGTTEARLLLIAGRPLGEPIVSYGPFVMNTEAEIVQAMQDYRSGRLA